MKKISSHQQQIVDLLKNENAFIVSSKFYNHQKVIKRYNDNYDPSFHLCNISKATLECLVNKGAIKQFDNTNQYILVD